MAQRLVIIQISGTPRALSRIEEDVDTVVEDGTMRGGIDALTTEVLDGHAAKRAIDILSRDDDAMSAMYEALEFLVTQISDPANAHHTLGALCQGAGIDIARNALQKAKDGTK